MHRMSATYVHRFNRTAASPFDLLPYYKPDYAVPNIQTDIRSRYLDLKRCGRLPSFTSRAFDSELRGPIGIGRSHRVEQPRVGVDGSINTCTSSRDPRGLRSSILRTKGSAMVSMRTSTPYAIFRPGGFEMLICQSFSKNFALYGERCGALDVVCPSEEMATSVHDQLCFLIRSEFSSSPTFGARLVENVCQILGKGHVVSGWRLFLQERAS
jgi:hypothetical protein